MGKANPEMASETMDVDELDVSIKPPIQTLSKSARKNLKKKEIKKLKEEAKANRPPKPEQEPRLPGSIVLPERSSRSDAFEDDEALFVEIKRRLHEHNAQTVRVSPIPKACPPSLLQDLCPTAIAVRLPSKNSCRYAFLEFRTASEAQTAIKALSGKQLAGKALTAESCGAERALPAHGDKPTNWKPATERTIQDFDMTNLYISRLPRFTERTELAQVFRTASNIKFDKLPDGTCKGSCLLRFRTRDAARIVFASLHGTLFKGIPIVVNFAIKNKATRPSRAVVPHDEKTNRVTGPIKRKATGGECAGKKTAKRARIGEPNQKTPAESASTKMAKKDTTSTIKKQKKGAFEGGIGEFSLKKGAVKKPDGLPKMQAYQMKWMSGPNNKKPKIQKVGK